MNEFRFRLRVRSTVAPRLSSMLNRLPCGALPRHMVLCSWVMRGIERNAVGQISFSSGDGDHAHPHRRDELNLVVNPTFNARLYGYLSEHPEYRSPQWLITFAELGAREVVDGNLLLHPLDLKPAVVPAAIEPEQVPVRTPVPATDPSPPVHQARHVEQRPEPKGLTGIQIEDQSAHSFEGEMDLDDLQAVFVSAT